MAKLPSFEELGQINVRNTRDPAGYYDFFPTANAADRITSISKTVGRGTEAIGQGIAQLGSGIGSALSKVESSNDQLNGALANSSWAASKANLDYEVSQSADPDALMKNFPARYNQALETASVNLNDKQKQLFMAGHGDDLQRSLAGVTRRANTLFGDKAQADTFTNLTQLRDSQLKTDDPNEHARAIHEAGAAIDSLADRGYITRLKAAEAKNTWVTDFATAWVGSKPPDERLRLLNETIGQGGREDIGPLVPAGQAPKSLSLRSSSVDIKNVDQRLVDSVSAGAAHLPAGYRVQINEGYNPQGHVIMSQHHVAGRGALDVEIIGPNGPIPNKGADSTGMYTRLARATYAEMKARHPELDGQLAWGGNFGTVSGGNVPDLMHFDIGGDRGHFGRLASLGGGPASRSLTKEDYDRVQTTPADWSGTREEYVRKTLGIQAQSPSTVAGVRGGGFDYQRYSAVVKAIESGGNPDKTSPAGYKGLYQFGPSEWAKYGSKYGTITNPAAQERAMYDYTSDHYRELMVSLGRAPAPAEMYLAHQQGVAAAVALINNPYTPAGQLVPPKNISANGGDPNAPALQFVQKLDARFNAVAASQGSGGVDTRLASLIPRDKLVHMQRQAENDVEHRTRTERMAADQERAKVRSLISSDIQSIQTTGVPVSEVSPERVAASLGDQAAAEFQVQRDVANRFHTQTFDFGTLPPDQLEARAESLRPPDGDPHFSVKSKYYDAAWKLVRETIGIRQTDPAGAVGSFPDVQKAMEGASLESNPESYRAVGHARLAAQGLIGILPDQQSPISRDEAQRLWARVNAMPEDRRGAEIRRVDQILRTAFGDDGATSALRYALHSARVSHAVSEQAVAILRRLAAGQPMTADQASGFDKAAGHDASEAAVSGVGEPRQNIDTGKPIDEVYRGRGAQPHPEWPARMKLTPPPAKYPTVTDDDIDLLRKNPERVRRNFDRRYGPGSADTVLRRFQEAPVQ